MKTLFISVRLSLVWLLPYYLLLIYSCFHMVTGQSYDTFNYTAGIDSEIFPICANVTYVKGKYIK